MIVWMLGKKIFCSVLYCVRKLCTMVCTHMWTVNLHVGLGFRFCVFVQVEHYMCCYVSLGQFILVLRAFVVFSFFSAKPRDWLGRTSPKWPILCRVGRKTLAQSIPILKVSGLHSTTTLTSLFFYIISTNFNALIPSFLQFPYSSFVEYFILPLKNVFHRLNDVIVTW